MLTSLSNTSGQPNATVVVQPGMQVEPVVIVDQNGNAVTPLVNPMTTLGDMIDGGASGAPARLAGPTVAAKRFLTSTGNGTIAATPAWGTISASDLPVVSGQYLTAPSVYAPASVGTLTVSSSGSWSAFSSANVNTGSFTAPASGSVVVTAAFTITMGSASSGIAFSLANHGTASSVVCNAVTAEISSAQIRQVGPLIFTVGSLTAGQAYQFDLVGSVQSNQVSILALGSSAAMTSSPVYGSPVTMTVQAV